MAAMRQRPRLMLGFALALQLACAGCSLFAPAAETASDRTDQARRLGQTGKHAESARAYEALAAEPGADRDFLELQSADQWTSAGNLDAARSAMALVSPDARAKLPVLRALVAGELAVAENDGARAIRELDQIPVPAPGDEAQAYWWIRGKGAFLAGHPVEGVRSYLERERSLTDPAALRASREDLFAHLRAAAERGTSLKVPPKTDGIVAGWLELGPVAVELARDPMHASAALAQWRQHYPLHPANDSVLAGAQNTLAVANTFPDQIALLLPLSGRSEPVGVAVRDGFIAAYLEQAPNARPHLKIYDVAVQSVTAAYNQAIEDGAGFVVGPLTKEDVAAVAPLAAGRAPVLALNFLGDGATVPRNLYQFALLPEDEARIVARRLATEGKLHGVAIVPDGEWGNRVSAAFQEELAHQGGAVLDVQHYEPARVDFTDIIRQSLQVHTVKGEPSTHRTDAQFVFIAGSASSARLIMPQLKFHYAGDVPVYSTSDSFEPGAGANSDIEGLSFPDMPWMISADPITGTVRDAVREAWPARTERRDRLYAFGFDAYRLVPVLRGKNAGDLAEIAGMTGKLRLDEHNRIRRELEWAQIKNGVPAGL